MRTGRTRRRCCKRCLDRTCRGAHERCCRECSFQSSICRRRHCSYDRRRGESAVGFYCCTRGAGEIVQAQPDYGPALGVLGLIDAGLGRKEEALREGRRAVELLPVEKDSINGTRMIECFAIIAAWIGDKDLACEHLLTAISHPSFLSYGNLKLLPFWDPLRGDPRFEKIVASLAPKQ